MEQANHIADANTTFGTQPVAGMHIRTRDLHKFGGSSLADAGCFLRVANIVQEHCGSEDIFVVSAAGKSTNRLIAFVDYCGQDAFAAHVELSSLLKFQLELVNGLLVGEQLVQVGKALRAEFTQLRKHAEVVVDDNLRSQILGHGEIWSARLLSALLNQFGLASEWLDSRTVLRASAGAQPVIDEAQSEPLVQHAIQSLSGHRVVVTGFMASNEDGQTVLLGRNGSDYSATMFGALAGSPKITIWSDVEGVYSADPRHVESASLLPKLSLLEANEMANLGASVLHRRSLQPLSRYDSSVALRSSHQPESGSTTIERQLTAIGPKVVTSIDSVAVFAVSSPGGESTDQVAARVRSALKKSALRPIAVTKKHAFGTVRFVFTQELAAEALRCMENAGFTATPVDGSHSVIALVGAGVAHLEATRNAFFDAISQEDAVAVLQSDLSLFAVLKNSDVKPILRQLHDSVIPNA